MILYMTRDALIRGIVMFRSTHRVGRLFPHPDGPSQQALELGVDCFVTLKEAQNKAERMRDLERRALGVRCVELAAMTFDTCIAHPTFDQNNGEAA